MATFNLCPHSQFKHEQTSYGRYKLTYTSAVTGKSWHRVTNSVSDVDRLKQIKERGLYPGDKTFLRNLKSFIQLGNL